MNKDSNSDMVIVTVVSLMAKTEGAEFATPSTEPVMHTASNGSEYILTSLREGKGTLPEGIIDMRPTRVKAFFNDRGVDLSQIKAGVSLALSRAEWDSTDDEDGAESEAPF
tara:strand:- start:717 stop:1049 length:333 start_codon:yes stop_codon:yes gene_type:complete